MKTIVVFFSKSGRTKQAAEWIAAETQADLYQIQTLKTYPQNYFRTLGIAKAEFQNKEYPYLRDSVPDFSEYEKVIIGFPIWFGTCPRAVLSFLKGSDLQRKDIYPFCTSGMTKCTDAERDIKNESKGATIHHGMRVGAHSADLLSQWLKEE